MDDLSVFETAMALARRGYHVVPVIPHTKAASLPDWVHMRLLPGDIPDYFSPDGAQGLGVLLGTKVRPEAFLVGIDIDVEDDRLIEAVKLAVPGPMPAKRGSKGITYFVRTQHPMKKKILHRKDPVTGVKIPMIELLGQGQQTVIPPSTHPKGMQYIWSTDVPALYDVAATDLPELTSIILSEIELAIHKPTSPLFLLNTMSWLGESGGGDIHNSVLAAVATMVSMKWSDEAIWARVDRATKRAVIAFGDDYDWPGWEEQVAGFIKSAREKGFDQKPKKERIHRIVTRWFMDDFVGAGRVYNRDGRLALYKDGAFDIMSPDELRHLIAVNYKEPETVSLHSPDWSLIVSNILDLSQRWPETESNRRVCLANGTFDMNTCELGEWQREDYLISRLAFDWNGEAQCPIYDKFMEETFAGQDDPERAQETYEEFVSHTLFECTDYHKFMVIKGQPRTGKSTLMAIAQMMHGVNAVSAVPVHEFGNERYRTAMVGKLLNVVGEVAATSHAADDFLKAVTAGDPVQVRFLYAEPYLVKLSVRLMIACNEMFRVRDTSGAVEARMLVLTCDNFIPEEKRDKQLVTKLRGELPGIFNRMCKAWLRLRDRNQFNPPKLSEIEIRNFSLENNHVLQWLQERCVEGQLFQDLTYIPNPDAATETSQLYLDFAEWGKLNGFKPLSSTTFAMKLSQIHDPRIDMTAQVKWIGKRSVRVRPLTLYTQPGY
jgi:P4 family phage/plasmid primase-like protien